VTINELRKVLEKLGVWLASEDDLKNLFKFYDKNKNNSIDY
jgi:Ca2+-binding EF-hand superfamily protein